MTGSEAAHEAVAGRAARQRMQRWLVPATFVVLAIAMAIVVAAAGLDRALESDDVARQRVIDIWLHEGHGTTWLSENLYYPRFPLYLALDVVGWVGRRGAVVSSIVLNVIAAGAFACGLLQSGDLRRPLRPWTAVGLLSLVTIAPFAWDQAFYSPNGHALEVGIAVLGLGLLTPVLRRGGLAVAAFVVGLALVWLSDPYVLYFLGGAALLVCAVDLPARDRRGEALRVGAVIAGSGVLAWVLRRLVDLADVVSQPIGDGALHLPAFDQLGLRIDVVWTRLVSMLGVSLTDLTSGDLADVTLAWLRLGLVVLALVGAWVTIRRWASASVLARSFVVAAIATPVVVVVLNQVDEPRIVFNRYLMVVPIAVFGLAVLAIDAVRPRVRRPVGIMLAALVVLSVGVGAAEVWRSRDAVPDAPALDLAAGAAAQGWDRVYGQYWVALPPDVLVDDDVRWVNVECSPGTGLRQMRWNSDSAQLRTRADQVAVALRDLGCREADLERAYGPSTRKVRLGDTEFLVWDDPPERLLDLT